MTTEQRLERLEREIRWMKRGTVIAAMVLAVVLLASAAAVAIVLSVSKEPKHLKVGSLTMKDDSGRQRFVLTTKDDGAPGLYLLDEAGEPRVSLELLNYDAPALFFRDKAGEMRASLVLIPNGKPCLMLDDEMGVTRASLSLTKLSLRDAEGEVIWQAPKD